MASKLFPKHTQHLVTLSTLLQYNRCCVFQVTLRGNWNNLLDVLDLILHTPLEVHKAFAHKINALIICYIKCNVYKILNNCMKLEQYYNIHSGVRYDIEYNIWFTTLKYFKRNIMTPCYHLGPIYTSVFFFLNGVLEWKRSLFTLAFPLRFRNDLRLHYTTENACHMTIHAGTTIDIYK